MIRILLVISALLSFKALAQDSLNVLSYDSYIQSVMEHHPYAFQANITQAMGESRLRQSRGAFDPKLFGDVNQKYFDDKQYYSHINGGVKIPTWFGISAEAGYTLNDGLYLNPEQRVPESGLWYAGLRLELGNGLIIDQRRAELEKAKLYRTSTELERIVLLNQLQRDASIAYYKWRLAYKKVLVYELAYKNASERLIAVQNAARFGDKAYIDSVEVSISVQNRYISLVEAQNYFKNTELKLEMYLWADGFIPVEVENTIPDIEQPFSETIFPISLDSIVINHPFLTMNDLKVEQQRIDLQLKKEQLKPKLTLKYNAINEPVNGNPLTTYSPANYTWGASFAYPLLTRKERGGVQLARLKLQDAELKNTMTEAQIEFNLESIRNSYQMSVEQFAAASQLVESSQVLYNAERDLFRLGESSVFMINSRESQWLKSQIQLIEIENESSVLEAEMKFQLMDFVKN